MSSRRLQNLQEKAARIEAEIRTLEQIVTLKDTVRYINDDTVVARALFPSSLDLWKKIVAAQIQLYNLREKEKLLRREYEKEQNRIIDFSVLDKYRRFKHKKRAQEGSTDEHSNAEEEHKDPNDGFEIRFKLSNAYEAIRRQEQVLTRPKLNPFVEKQGKSGPVYFFYDRCEKQWKRFYPDGKPDAKRTSRSLQKRRVVPSKGLPFQMQQQLRKINHRPGTFPTVTYTYSQQQTQDAKARGATEESDVAGSRVASVSVPSQFVPSRDSTFIAKRPSVQRESPITASPLLRKKSSDSKRHHHQIIEETKELLNDTDSGSALPGKPDGSRRKLSHVSLSGSGHESMASDEPRSNKSRQERRKIEKLKMVASQMSALQEELEHAKEEEEEEEGVDDEEMFKNCRYLYRLCHCRCIGRHSTLVAEEIRKQVAGTIDLLDHDDEGLAVGSVECVYCMKTPRAHVTSWLASLRTGSTCGVYGDPRYDWFPKLNKASS